MKSIFLLALLVAAAVANPLYATADESDSVIGPVDEEEVVATNDVEPSWHLIPDGDGFMHFVDINAVDMPVEPLFNAFTDVRVRLYTRNNRNPGQGQHILLNNAAQLLGSHFNPAHQTRFIIHGWQNDGTSSINNLLRNAYLDRGTFNVFVVDWGLGAQTVNYLTSVQRIGDVGHYVAQYIDFVNRERGVSFASITVVGHSLGAHTSGIAGKRVTRGRINAIVALDAAMPLFTIGNTANRVHYNDAVYVESIHTDTGRLGFDQPLGDASFYPAWGRSMPGCGIDLAGTCGHSRAVDYFAESIRAANNFWATRCQGYNNILTRVCPSAGASQLMGGEPVVRAANGIYYLGVNANSPFGQGFR